MSADEKDTREESDQSFDQDQQHMFGNEHQPAPDAARPQVGTQTDPLLPGAPIPGTEAGTPPINPAHGDEPQEKP